MNTDGETEQQNNRPTYWERENVKGTKPLVKEESSHKCEMMPLSSKLSLTLLSIFNYADTVTDILVTVDMFRSRSYILGVLSLVSLLYVGVMVPLFLGANKTWTKGRILAAFGFASTQYFALTEMLSHPKGKVYSRRQGGTAGKTVSLTSRRSSLNDAIFFEKMSENQTQMLLQLIHIAPVFISTTIKLNDWTLWHYIKLGSLIITVASLTRTCSSYEFNRHHLNPRLFNFYIIGKGWMSLHPQYLILLLVHSSLIASKFLSLIYLMILVDHDFVAETLPYSCSVITAMRTSGTGCGFVVRVGCLVFLYKVSYYGVVSVIALPRCFFLVRKDVFQLWRGSMGLRRRLNESINVCLFPFHLVSSQRNFMSSRIFINHLQNVKMTTAIVKIGPSVLHSIGTLIFAAIFYSRRNEDSVNIDLGFNPLILPFIGLGIDCLHLVTLTIWVFWADPQHSKTLANEKILDLLLRSGKVPDLSNVTCARAAKDIIREVIAGDENFGVSKEMVEERIVDMNIQLPTTLPQHSSLVQKLRFNFKVAVLKKSGVHDINAVQGVCYQRLSEELE